MDPRDAFGLQLFTLGDRVFNTNCELRRLVVLGRCQSSCKITGKRAAAHGRDSLNAGIVGDGHDAGDNWERLDQKE